MFILQWTIRLLAFTSFRTTEPSNLESWLGRDKVATIPSTKLKVDDLRRDTGMSVEGRYVGEHDSEGGSVTANWLCIRFQQTGCMQWTSYTLTQPPQRQWPHSSTSANFQVSFGHKIRLRMSRQGLALFENVSDLTDDDAKTRSSLLDQSRHHV